jgi:hypothetical protein
MKPRPSGWPLAALNTTIVAGALARGLLELLVWSWAKTRRRHKTW